MLMVPVTDAVVLTGDLACGKALHSVLWSTAHQLLIPA